MKRLRLVVLGLSITSSFGNGHATTFRGLLKAFHELGHSILFLERDLAIYRGHRDLPDPSFCEVEIYDDVAALSRFDHELAAADVVMVGSYVRDGPAVIDHVLAQTKAPVLFYDIDTPITSTLLERGDCPYLRPDQIPRFAAYLSFTGGPLLDWIEVTFQAQRARPLYCAVDPEVHHAVPRPNPSYQLGYLGTYSEDRQGSLQALLMEPARRLSDQRFVVAGAQYPEAIQWPQNVERQEHIPPDQHAGFYTSQRFTLNVTRQAMRRWGYSPSVRLFEAAACGTPVLSDAWNGIEEFFAPGKEILIVSGSDDVERILTETDEASRRAIGRAARKRILREHTALARAKTLEAYVVECLEEARTGVGPAETARVQARPASGHLRDAVRPGGRRKKTDSSEQEAIRRLGPWFHNLHLPSGSQTAPEHPLGDFPAYKWDVVQERLPVDLHGSHVLDIGCNGGFYCIEAAKRGAHVTALDMDPRYLEQTRWAARQFGVEDRITLRHAQVYELASDDMIYDHVLFLGVLYHLRYPLLALDIVRERVGDRLVLQTMQTPAMPPGAPAGPDRKEDLGYLEIDQLRDPGWPHMAFIESRLAGDPTNWWVPNAACVAALLRSSGFTDIEHDGDIWSARPDPERGTLRSWNRSELQAVLQRPWKDNVVAKVVPRDGTLETTQRSGQG